MMAEKKAGRREGECEAGGLRVSRRIRDSIYERGRLGFCVLERK